MNMTQTSPVIDQGSENCPWVHCWHGFLLLCCSHSVECFHLLPGSLPQYPTLTLHMTPNNTENLKKNNNSCFISCPTFDCIHVLVSPIFICLDIGVASSVLFSVLALAASSQSQVEGVRLIRLKMCINREHK